MLDIKNLEELSNATGWNIIRGSNTYCPQVVYGNREDDRNFLCCWWNGEKFKYLLCGKVEGRYIFNDRIVKAKRIKTLIKELKAAEIKYKTARENIKLKAIERDFL